MNGKNLVSLGLLLFVGTAVAVLVNREVGRDATPATVAAEGDGALPERGLVAYYFHGETRCPTCRNIESYAQEAIATGFAPQLASGKVQWRVVNYESPANARFATEYEIVAPTVVLVNASNGRVEDWRNLTRVWELVGDKDAFVTYVKDQTEEMLGATAG